MKLVEINDVRVGQIRKNFDDLILIEAEKPNGFLYYQAFNEFGGFMNKDVKASYKFLAMPIIGKLGITHRFEENRLVERPRSAGFQVDDIVKFKWDPRLYVINREIDFGIKKTHPDNSCFEATNDLYGSRQLVDFELKRIGILGVTHEFVNDREVVA